MKKFLLSIVAILTILSGYAQNPGTTPPAGSFGVVGDVAYKGLGSVTINVQNAVINRDCDGFVILYVDGEQAISVPAANERRIYFDAGFEEVGGGGASNASIRIDFWPGSLTNCPYVYQGDYRMVVPAGLYSVNGAANKAFMVDWTITDHPKSANIVCSPSTGSTVGSLSQFTLTFEGASSVELAKETAVYVMDPYFVSSGEGAEEAGGANASDIHPTVNISGNVATLTFAEPFEKACNLTLYVEDGAFNADGVACDGIVANIKVTGEGSAVADPSGIVCVPANGSTFEGGFPKNDVSESVGVNAFFAPFGLYLPYGCSYKNVSSLMMAKRAYLTDANGEKLGNSYALNPRNVAGTNMCFFYNVASGSGAAGTFAVPVGTYYLNFDEGSFTYNDTEGNVVTSPALKFGPYYITAPTANYDIAPAVGNTVEELSSITVTFDAGTTLDFADIYNRYAVIKAGTIVYDVLPTLEGNVMTLTPSTPISAPGEYVVEFPDLKVNGAIISLDNVKYTVERQFVDNITYLSGEQVLSANFVNDVWNAFYVTNAESAQIEFVVPTGFDSIYYKDNNSEIGGGPVEGDDDIQALEMIPTTALEAEGFKLAVGNKIPVVSGVNDYTITYAANGVATNPTPLMITVSPALKVLNTYPEKGVAIPSFPDVDNVYITYNITGDMGAVLNPSAGNKIVVKKDGNLFATYDVVNDSPNVYVDRAYNTRLVVNFGTPLEPGNYTVDVPQATVSGKVGGGDDSIVADDGYNESAVFEFTVAKAFKYAVSPAQNSEVAAADLATVTITYPEGTTVELNAEATEKPVIEFVDPAYTTETAATGLRTPLSTYTYTANGNVVTLTADEPAAITAFSEKINIKWDEIVVPANLWTVKEGEEAVANTEMTLGSYAVRAFTASSIKFEPALDTKGLSINDLEEIKITLPEGSIWAVASDLKEGSTGTMIVLCESPYLSGATFNYRFKSMIDERNFVLYRVPATSPTTATGNAAISQKGSTFFRLSANKIQYVDNGETKKNASLDIPAYDLEGIEGVPVVNITPKHDGAATSISSLTITMRRASVVADPDALITLHKDGVLVKSVKAGDTGTKAAQVGGTGTTSIAYSDLFKDENNAAFTEQGHYVFTIPAGAFMQKVAGTPEWTNPEYVADVYIVGDLDYEVSPKPAAFTGTTDDDLVCTPSEELTAISELVFTFPGAVKVEKNINQKSVLDNATKSFVTKKNMAKAIAAGNTNYSTTGSMSGLSISDVVIVNENTVKVVFNAPWQTATPYDRYPYFKLGAGLVNLTYVEDGVEKTAPSPDLKVVYQQIPLAKFALLDPVNDGFVAADKMSTISFEAAQAVYEHENSVAQLKDAEGNVVANYKGASGGSKSALINFNFTAPTAAEKEANDKLVSSAAELADGNYTFVIPEGTILAGSATSESLQVRNLSDFNYDFKVGTFDLNEDIKLEFPAAVEFTDTDSPFGPSQIVWVVKKDGAKINANCNKDIVVNYDGENFMMFKLDSKFVELIENYEGTYPALAFDLRSSDFGAYMPQLFGDWQFILPEGALVTTTGVTSNEFSVTYKYTETPKAEVDFTYELTPAATDVVSDLSQIKLTFVNEQLCTYDSNVATLTTPAGDVLKCSYPNQDGNSLIFKFNGLDNAAGIYTFTVNPGTVIVGSDDDTVEPNFEGLTVQYTLASVEVPELKDHFELKSPSAYDCDRTTATSEYGVPGLMMVSLYLDSNDIAVNSACTAPISISYNGTLLKEIYCAQPGDDDNYEPSVVIMNVGLTDDGDDLLEFVTKGELYMVFSNDPDEFAKYQQTGVYTVVIPDGALKLGGVEMKGMTLTYNYTDSANVDFEYVLNPDPLEMLTSSELLKTITLTFPGATYVSYNKKPVLTDPDGATIYANYPNTNWTDMLTFKFGNKNTDWTALGAGTYTLTLEKENYYVNNNNVANWPAETITVLYTVEDNNTTGIALVGVEAADSYDVYTLDGKVVKLNAAPAELFELESGLYIINGQKTYLKK